MDIKTARFVVSNSDVKKCPPANRPEYAFIGRSNVGKSSLINMLTNNSKLAKTSGKPGKTQLVNHFLINDDWYLVDLPGYGYAKVSKTDREKFQKLIRGYILNRKNLFCLFVLIDVRHSAQDVDLEFMQWLGESQIPFSILFTKADKIKPEEVEKNIINYREKMFEIWEETPPMIATSSEKRTGKNEVLEYIDEINLNSSLNF